MRRVDITAPAGGGVAGEFEEAFAKYVGVKYCVTTNSCCAATHIALGAFGVGPGDEVIVSPYTWGQTVAPIIHQNGIPVYADIDPKTYNLDPESVAQRITENTKAIVAVHIYGHPADMDPLMLTKASTLFSIPQGAQVIRLTATSGTGAVTVRWYNRYLGI